MTWPRSSTRDTVRFVTLDPDIHTFTYDLANRDELCEAVAAILDADPLAAQEYGRELVTDANLRAKLSQRGRWRLDAKNRPPLGRHVASYCAVRLLKPSLIVESGIKHGLGTAVLLRALERNSAAGHHGRLLSIDPDPEAGWLVDADANPNWELVRKASEKALPEALFGRPVEMLISDSLPDRQVVEWELTAALSSGSQRTLVVANHHWNDVVRVVALAHGARFGEVREVPAGHPYPGRGIDMAYFIQADSRAQRASQRGTS